MENDYQTLLQTLFSFKDESYCAFQKKLLKNDEIHVIGVRVPLLRKLSKDWKGKEETLLSFPNDYYEVVFLKCAAVSALPFEAFIRHVDGAVALIDNWAVCDSFIAPCIRDHRGEFLPYIRRYLKDEGEFSRRYALVTLLHFYMDREYLPLVFESALNAGEGYYAQMAAAWLIAETLVKFYPDGVEFLKNKRLDGFVQNAAILKARQSYRLTYEQKERLKELRM